MTIHDPVGPQPEEPGTPVRQPGGPPEPVTPLLPDPAPADPPEPQPEVEPV